jgi:hypothetical protein
MDVDDFWHELFSEQPAAIPCEPGQEVLDAFNSKIGVRHTRPIAPVSWLVDVYADGRREITPLVWSWRTADD